jgi:SAM-dependent methyltransferase
MDDFSTFQNRYNAGENRTKICYEMVANDIANRRTRPTVLDIGCGTGFFNDVDAQRALAAQSARYIGVEPDPSVNPGEHINALHRAEFLAAPVEPQSIDIAFAVMVIEHLADPQPFWNKVHEVLKPGGVFWGFTVDRRSLFAIGSLATEKLKIKDMYLNVMMGRRGEDRWMNYPVYYRSNTPRHVAQHTKQFARCNVINLACIGDFHAIVPKQLTPITDRYEAWVIRTKRPGTLLAIRAEK